MKSNDTASNYIPVKWLADEEKQCCLWKRRRWVKKGITVLCINLTNAIYTNNLYTSYVQNTSEVSVSFIGHCCWLSRRKDEEGRDERWKRQGLWYGLGREKVTLFDFHGPLFSFPELNEEQKQRLLKDQRLLAASAAENCIIRHKPSTRIEPGVFVLLRTHGQAG